MIIFRQCYPEHLAIVQVQAAQLADLDTPMSLAEREQLCAGLAFSGWLGSDCIGCAGIVDIWQGRSVAWALLSRRCAPHMLTITRFVRKTVQGHPSRRIESTVAHEFEDGHKWLKALGFTCETPNGMQFYDVQGRTVSQYARIKL